MATETSIGDVTYNAENRPVRFESADGATVIDCTYDYMGRRHTRKVTVNGAVSGVFRWFLFWDSTQPTATRPLAIRKDSTWYAYGWDLTKNVTEVFGKAGYLRTAYTYTPYGEATAAGDVTQPITWSSEYADDELALIYYNYRHYNPTDGRWINRDPIEEEGGWNLYAFVGNTISFDILGTIEKADIKIIVNRQYFEWETLSDWTVYATDSKIAAECKVVTGKGIELKKGRYKLSKREGYSNITKNYPLPEGIYQGAYTVSNNTSIDKLFKYNQNFLLKNIRKKHSDYNERWKNYREQKEAYDNMVFFMKWFNSEPQIPAEEHLQPIFSKKEQITYHTANGSIMLFYPNDIYTKNFGLHAKNGFSGIRWHVGTSVNWSRGCMIVGSEYLEDVEKDMIYGDGKRNLKLHVFDGNDSLIKALELSLFACCVKSKLGKCPTVEVHYKSS